MKPYTVLLSILVLTAQTFADTGKKDFSLEEIFTSSTFATKGLAMVRWVDGGKAFTYLETDTATKSRNLYRYTVATGKKDLVMDGRLLVTADGEKPMRIASYEWSKDGTLILVTGALPARRIKTGGDFGFFDVEKKTFRLLTNSDEEQAIIKFSPDGSAIGFVRGNNLFVMDHATGIETQLTTDGSPDILNGRFDWVYEEEFSIIDGWEWSPDGKHIAFWRLDQSHVSTFPLVRYPVAGSHADIETMRYPKAGDANAYVQIGVVSLATRETRWLDLGPNTDIYIPRIQWTANPEILSVQRLNRGQDTLELMLADIAKETLSTVLTETDTAWLDIHDDLHFLKRSKEFLWTSFRDGFNHIYLYGLDGTSIRQVTSGRWEVTQIVGVNERRKLVYFIGTHASPLERHLYSVRFDGSGLKRITKDAGWHSANFSPDHLVFLNTHSNALTPPSITLRTNEGATVARLIVNRLDTLRTYNLGQHRFFSHPTSDGDSLNCWMITPPDFSPDRKYPVLIYVYGGPGSQTVTHSWGGSRYLWNQYLAQRGYIVMSVDNRGTGARGKSFMQVTHNRLGIRETDDYIETARYLATLSYVDASRIGIWGWSGGGFMTCLSMTRGAEYFKAGIAVAAVTDLKYYDTIWTERYMDTPQRNPEGYRETSALTHAASLRGKLLIIHGTTDDNVHWQNAIAFIDELIKENKQVQTMFYPGRAHGISGGNSTIHLYTLMTNFLLENL